MTTPRATALADQLAAATAEAVNHMHLLAPALGSPVRQHATHPAVDRIVHRLAARLTAGQVTYCRHLNPDAPQPTWWPAWAPGRIRCLPCAVAAGERIKGTAEDRRCDACRRPARGGPYNGALLLSGELVERGPFVGVWPPVTIWYGLCGRCLGTPDDGKPRVTRSGLPRSPCASRHRRG